MWFLVFILVVSLTVGVVTVVLEASLWLATFLIVGALTVATVAKVIADERGGTRRHRR